MRILKIPIEILTIWIHMFFYKKNMKIAKIR